MMCAKTSETRRSERRVSRPHESEGYATLSVEGGAAAQVLKRFFKDAAISFSTCSLTMPLVAEQCEETAEVLRSFNSFTHAAEENGLSRVLVGFHFRHAVNDGIKHSRKIGDRAVNLFLKPVKK